MASNHPAMFAPGSCSEAQRVRENPCAGAEATAATMKLRTRTMTTTLQTALMKAAAVKVFISKARIARGMATFQDARKALLAETRRKVATAVGEDTLIIQAVTTLDQLERAANGLVKKGREWYAAYDPETEKATKDHDAFLAASTEDKRSKETMGGSLTAEDKATMDGYLATLRTLTAERDALAAYVEAKMQAHCPNLSLLAGSRIAAQLLSHAGSLQRLATVPSSTLQLYGAETALFRHLKDRSHKAPKYGILFNHPLVQKTGPRERGKAARGLADKLSLCARLDLFKGELKAQEYKQLLAKKFTDW